MFRHNLLLMAHYAIARRRNSILIRLSISEIYITDIIGY